MNIKISCIIPYYNVEKELLFECINSILQQDFQNYEIIIVDDGSDEVHAAYLDEFSKLDSRIKIIHQDNNGASAARNMGIANARGEYITFMDADDMLVPFFFSEAYLVASKNNAEYVIGKVLSIPDRNYMDPIRYSVPEVMIYEPKHFRPILIGVSEKTEDGGFFGRGPVGKLVKREVLDNVFFPKNVVLGEDVIWNLDIISKCEKLYFVNQIWYLYWYNSDSASHRYDENIVYKCEQQLKELLCRIDLSNEEEAIAYFLHVYEFLRKHIYYCYLGRKECSLPIIKRNHIFSKLCCKEPWNIYESYIVFKNFDRRTRLRYLLVKCRLLYWYWFFKDRVKRN